MRLWIPNCPCSHWWCKIVLFSNCIILILSNCILYQYYQGFITTFLFTQGHFSFRKFPQIVPLIVTQIVITIGSNCYVQSQTVVPFPWRLTQGHFSLQNCQKLWHTLWSQSVWIAKFGLNFETAVPTAVQCLKYFKMKPQSLNPCTRIDIIASWSKIFQDISKNISRFFKKNSNLSILAQDLT